jgi:ribonuclease HI
MHSLSLSDPLPSTDDGKSATSTVEHLPLVGGKTSTTLLLKSDLRLLLTVNGKTKATLHFRLGTTEEHTVFEAELVGILLGLQLIKANQAGNKMYAIGVDNQAAIKALASKLNKSGHYLAAEILNTTKRMGQASGKKYALMVRWTAGHSKIPGNEAVDVEVKKAADGHTSEGEWLLKILRKPLKHSKSAARQTQQEHIKASWSREWAKSPRYNKLKHIDPALPSRKFIELISNKKINMVAVSKFFQLRLGHIPLNAYLHRFKIKESAQCPACGAQRETPQHFIVECPAYTHERWKLRPKKGRSEIKYAEVLGSKDKAIAIVHYIIDTRCFAQDEQPKQA